MEGMLASASRISTMYRPLPEEYNHAGFVHGGNILRHMDAVGSMAAIRYARGRVVTAAVEHMSFRAPVAPNEIIHFHAAVNGVWNSSMEVGIRAESEEPYSGNTRHVGTCYFTFVGLDDRGKPRILPPLIAETAEDRRRMMDAARRMAFSRMEQKRASSSVGTGGLVLEMLPGRYAVCTFSPEAALPDLSLLPPHAFISITCTGSERTLALEESNLHIVQGSGIAVAPGFVCLKIPAREYSVDITGLTAILASVHVTAHSVATCGALHLLVSADDIDRAMERLAVCGHTIAGVV